MTTSPSPLISSASPRRSPTVPVGGDTGHGPRVGEASQADPGLVGYPPPPVALRLPVREVATATGGGDESPMVWAVSAHGGAGASALASRVGFVGDAGHHFPIQAGHIIVCAAETVDGLNAAHNAVLQHLNGLGGDSRLLAVVTRPARPGWEGRKTPAAIARMLELVSDPHLVGHLIRVGWDDSLALSAADQRPQLTPALVAAWMAGDDRERKHLRKSHPVEVAGLVPAVAALVEALSKDNQDTS